MTATLQKTDSITDCFPENFANLYMALFHIIYASRHEMSLRDLNQISIERNISETSQKHLKRDDIFLTSLGRLKDI